MTPAARVQAAIEILDQVIASARDDGPPADALVTGYFKTRRYAGSKDRRAVRDLVYLAIRAFGEPPTSGRAAFAGLADFNDFTRRFSKDTMGVEIGDLVECFDDSPHGPGPYDKSQWMRPVPFAGWAIKEALRSFDHDESELFALLKRAPLDLRVNTARAKRDDLLAAFPGSERTPLSPWGLRLPADTKINDHPAFLNGEVEVQDEGSQLIALACGPADGMRILDLCAGVGGKALALAAAAPGAIIHATDTNRQRLAKLAPRAARAGTLIDTMLLDGGREAEQLAPYAGTYDVVLVDAPCSGSGTWRRNPEGRWRLTPDRLDRVTATQSRLLDLAVPMVKPGGTLVYAVCSILAREGAGQAQDFLGRHSGWTAQDAFDFGRCAGPGRLLTPGHDGTDGFFVARFNAPC